MNRYNVVGLAILFLGLSSAIGQQYVIPKENVQQLFESIAETTDWDMSGDMVWGYFFTHSDRAALEKATPALEEMGYSFKSIYLADKESDDEPDLWWLHVERIETHSIDSLDITNQLLARFAFFQGLDSYDGMDVGPVTAPE